MQDRGRHYTVLFLPHEVSLADTGSKDDRLLCALIEAAVGDDRARAMLQRVSAAEMKAVIGKTTCVIGSRFHALVAGLSQGIPCMALSWSHKYRELLKPFGLERYTIESAGAAGGAATMALFDEFIDGVPDLKLGVDAALPEVRRQVTETFDCVADALQRPRRWQDGRRLSFCGPVAARSEWLRGGCWTDRGGPGPAPVRMRTATRGYVCQNRLTCC